MAGDSRADVHGVRLHSERKRAHRARPSWHDRQRLLCDGSGHCELLSELFTFSMRIILCVWQGAHAIALMTEWDEFVSLDYQKIYELMSKPAFIFDGRNILPHAELRKIGFEVL